MRALTFSSIVVLGCLGLAPPNFAADAAQKADPRPILHLTNDGFVVGDLVENPGGPALRWQSPAFTGPFEFSLVGVNAVHFPSLAKSPPAAGSWLIELHQGTILHGSIVAWNNDDVEIDANRLGKVHVKAMHIRRFQRIRNDGDIVYQGPSGTAGWELTPDKKGWKEDLGNLTTDQEGSAVNNVGVPARAAIEVVLSWTRRPDFVLSLGVGNDEQSAKQAFRLEVWGDKLVMQRELENAADPAEIQTIAVGAGRTHLQIFLDQNLGRCLVFSAAGNKLADINVKADKPQLHGGVRLDNLRGDVRLEQLRVSKWTGDLPREVKTDEPRIERADGSVDYGRILRFDQATGEFVLRGETNEVGIAASKIETGFYSMSNDLEAPGLLISYHDGMKVAGELVKSAEGALWMTAPTIAGTFRLPFEGLRSIIVVKQDALTDTDGEAPVGTFEADGIKLRGRLEDGESRAGATCLIWRPIGSETASQFRAGISGRVVYREPPPPPKPVQNAGNAAVIRGGARIVVGGMGVAGAAPARQNIRSGDKKQPSLFLLTGDTIPCKVTKIDELGVTFKTDFSDSAFVPHAKIKAVELSDPPRHVVIAPSKANRLLTLPRMQRDNPPTHLLRSVTGDYLRCRILEMNEEVLKVEVRLETKTIPRNHVARVIWLHAEGLGKDDSEVEAAAPIAADTRDGRMQVLQSNGVRITFVPNRFADSKLIGNSEILGDLEVPMKNIDQVLVASAIEKAAADLTFQQWKMKNAVDPKFVNEDDSSEGGSGGTESVLVGKPAPTFELDLLDGERFKLSGMKGRVVVLDFWATWCGPCRAAMPQVDRAAKAFADQGVQLIAVNLEESPKQIKSMLERHKLDVTVALDRDGSVAAKYQANAIPQTVVIDKDGVVSRVFIGADPHLEDQLKDSLKKLLGESAVESNKSEAKPTDANPSKTDSSSEKSEETGAKSGEKPAP